MPRILVVDDDPLVRAMLHQVLERAGYEVEVAEDGESAYRLCQEHPIDLIIMDMVMPGKGGAETIAEVRRDFPEVRIVAMSGGGRTGPYGYLKLAERFGAERVFPKPLERDTILEAIDELLTG